MIPNKFFLIQIVFDVAGQATKSMYGYADKNEAIAQFHKNLGGWMSKANEISGITFKLIDYTGANVIPPAHYEYPKTIAEPEETETPIRDPITNEEVI